MKFARSLLLSFLLLPLGTPGALSAADQPDDLTSLRSKAERGNAVAQYNLGLAHLQGRQTPVNVIEAYVWLTLAAEGGATGRALETALDTLTPEQLTAARRRLETLRTGNPALRAASASRGPSGGAPTIGEAAPARSGASAPVIGDPSGAARPAPIISIPSSSVYTPSEPKSSDADVATLIQDKRELGAELASAWKEVEQLKAQLATRTSASGDLSSAQAQLRDAQAALTKQATELAASRAEAAAAKVDQNKLQTQLATAQESLTRQTTAAAQSTDAARALEQERAAHATTQASLTQLKSQVADLTSGRTTLERESAARIAAAERTQTAASEETKKLAAQAAELTRKTDALAGELTTARNELASARQNLSAADDKLAATRSELAQTKAALDTATSHAQTASSRAEAGAKAESQLTALRQQVSTLEKEFETARTAWNRVTADKAAAESALNTAHQKLADSTTELTSLRQQMADSSRTASAAADQKATALQSELNDARTRLTAAERTAVTREAELTKLRSAAAAADARPTISATDLESARNAARDAQQQLAAINRELTSLRAQAATARDLEVRVRQLEAEKTAAVAKPGETGISRDELAKAVAAQAEAEGKLSTALRSYTLISQERDALQTRVNELAAKVNQTSQALTSAEAQARTATESAAVSVASSAELETLRNRAAAAERAAEAVRVELAHANQLLSAYRPGGAVPTRPPTAPAGEAARTHTIAPGETLSSISMRYYGTTNRWSDILAANRDVLVDERSFAAGRTLRIP